MTLTYFLFITFINYEDCMKLIFFLLRCLPIHLLYNFKTISNVDFTFHF